ncbi:hypothetical protein [Streptomyces sp. NBC_01669]|uniref:hypothetical protein n=1 Tax=Streptomyces sp. NBC_01669 TaxID=2975909 RepID=UPI00225717F1|nr:hypothetical protein [Streptomyces sp. NBC_01669]MCX4538237.1 hypothetical protein [Streptomyces sp. NBC_01669]
MSSPDPNQPARAVHLEFFTFLGFDELLHSETAQKWRLLRAAEWGAVRPRSHTHTRSNQAAELDC